MRDVTGHCPSCHAEGTVGQPCGEKSCGMRGYHFVPQEAFEKLRELPAARIDPRLGQCIGEYLLVDVLGSGGFGKVYLALQLPILMKTALKVMDRTESDPELADALGRRFEGEAAALATLNHPNIVRLLKYGVFQGLPYLVMEYIEGNRTLRTEMQSGSLAGDSIDPEVIAKILRQILNALDAAHARNIVHRDVKPENIMMQEVSGDQLFVKVLDFGLAKFVEERSETSLMIGTPAYMAPEQITRKNIGPWTDLYALGVLLFRLVTGRQPFVGDSTQETYAMKLDPTYDPMTQADGLDLPPELTAFLRQSIARDPGSRYSSAKEFRVAFDAVMPFIGKVAASPRPASAHAGHSLTEQVRNAADQAFGQVGSPSVLTTERRRITTSQPRIVERRPYRRLIGLFEGGALALVAILAIFYVTRYGLSTAPFVTWLNRAQTYMESDTAAGSSQEPLLASQRTVAIRIVSTPPGASIRNGSTNEDLGLAPGTVLVPPGATIRLHIQMNGYRDEILTVSHQEAQQQTEWPVHMTRRK
jgi:serine/threonine protein kinase